MTATLAVSILRMPLHAFRVFFCPAFFPLNKMCFLVGRLHHESSHERWLHWRSPAALHLQPNQFAPAPSRTPRSRCCSFTVAPPQARRRAAHPHCCTILGTGLSHSPTRPVSLYAQGPHYREPPLTHADSFPHLLVKSLHQAVIVARVQEQSASHTPLAGCTL
jgi:hypothetical protein